jgi:hypothetical protein
MRVGLCSSESISDPVECPQLAVAPGAVVLYCDLVLWEGQICPSETTVRVLDPVLRLRMQARPRLRAAACALVLTRVRRTSSLARRAMRVRSGTTTWTQSWARASCTPHRAAADLPVITVSGGSVGFEWRQWANEFS